MLNAEDGKELPSSNARPHALQTKSDSAQLTDMDEYICYGNRIAFLCDGQLLALTRKFKLTYQQMVLVAMSTLATGGLMGIAGFFVWRKGLFRKRYAALFGDQIYNETDLVSELPLTDSDPLVGAEGFRSHSQTTQTSSHVSTTSGVAGEPESPLGKSHVAHGSVAFRLFEFDPTKQQLVFSSLGHPVKFGTPLVVVHAESGRALRYLSHKGAVTISKPPVNLAFHRQVRASLDVMEESAALLPSIQKSGPPSLGSALMSSSNATQQQQPSHLHAQMLTCYPGGRKQVNPSNASSKQRRSRTQHKSASSMQSIAQRRSLDTNSSVQCSAERRGLKNATETTTVPSTDAPIESKRRRRRCPSTPSIPGGQGLGSTAIYRSLSESYSNLLSDITDTLQQQRERQRDRQELRRRQKALMRDLPNMSFNNPMGKYYVATIAPVRHQTTGTHRVPVAPADEYLRWGQPMLLVANYNGRACGIRPREYYKDSDLYLTTEATSTTIVPLREDGDLKCMAKESTRSLAHLEQRHVHLSVGTYNVWMMPRKVSALTSCSPKKNTRARMIGDVLPPCDIWVLTECFDYRARDILLKKLSDAGYFFFSPTVGHKRVNKSNMRKLLNGGVVLASKYPILGVRVKLFEDACAGADKLADKGVLYCKILKDGLLVHVFSTHLQAWNDPLSRSMRRIQMQMIVDFMRAMEIDQVNDVVLFVGDMNVDYWLNVSNAEYDEMLNLFEAKDPTVVCTPTLDNSASDSDQQKPTAAFKYLRKYSFDPRVNALAAEGLSTDGSLELLDYVLYSRKHRQPQAASSWIQPLNTVTPWTWRGQPQYNLSDHFPVVSEFLFDM
ncbi:hypothetical protein PsorP6_010218 [Peronosclerospora sorghi]|uniref:Uncharacterized protein n=1 Tax=Peronosclerospora sorghi TaxID=230839 RepID=A0ACC0VUG9_9STRA|nr:hypothetical protein PsorP6_010218 [Peronosclerospora sorghi]